MNNKLPDQQSQLQTPEEVATLLFSELTPKEQTLWRNSSVRDVDDELYGKLGMRIRNRYCEGLNREEKEKRSYDILCALLTYARRYKKP